MTKIIFLGSGDAFSAGGRFYSSLLVIHDDTTFLVDIGPTTPLALRHAGISFEKIDHIFLTHTHGDHLAGLPFLFLEFQYRVARDSPITVVGASGISKYAEGIVSGMYASLAKENRRFVVEYQNIDDQPYNFASTTVLGFPMAHEPYSRAFRFEFDGKTLAVTGDTEWNDNIATLADDADLLIIECSFFNSDIPGHLSYKSLERNLLSINNRRTLLYHLGQDVLERKEKLHFDLAEDFLELEL
ncbi:MAG: MBL fold metallo-hydrolase [Candidatus Hodarchaeales archaeon]|jgi:ribonuclease BN (tRNA processing enzyme)